MRSFRIDRLVDDVRPHARLQGPPALSNLRLTNLLAYPNPRNPITSTLIQGVQNPRRNHSNTRRGVLTPGVNSLRGALARAS